MGGVVPSVRILASVLLVSCAGDDGPEEFDFLAAGSVTYAFHAMDVPLLGLVAAAINGNIELGFRGEELQ
jgi:hypothetical protein